MGLFVCNLYELIRLSVQLYLARGGTSVFNTDEMLAVA
jgi:hypothetical protein